MPSVVRNYGAGIIKAALTAVRYMAYDLWPQGYPASSPFPRPDYDPRRLRHRYFNTLLENERRKAPLGLHRHHRRGVVP